MVDRILPCNSTVTNRAAVLLRILQKRFLCWGRLLSLWARMFSSLQIDIYKSAADFGNRVDFWERKRTKLGYCLWCGKFWFSSHICRAIIHRRVIERYKVRLRLHTTHSFEYSVRRRMTPPGGQFVNQWKGTPPGGIFSNKCINVLGKVSKIKTIFLGDFVLKCWWVGVKITQLFSGNIHSVISTANIQKCPETCNTY